MKMSKGVALACLVVVLTVGVSGLTYSSDSGQVTVAQFVRSLAINAMVMPSATNVAKGATSRPATAWANQNSSATLTYGAVARIAADLGVQVAPPANPDAVVGPAQAGAIASLIAAARTGASVALSADDVPSQCLSSDNRGKCVDCCKEASGQGGQFCGRFCHENVPPPPSPGEPQP